MRCRIRGPKRHQQTAVTIITSLPSTWLSWCCYRLFVNGVLWVLRSGAQWDELPERYGKHKSVHKRFARWAKKGVWERIFAELIDDPKNEYVMLDATLVRAHQQAATGKGAAKKGERTRLWGVPEVD